MDNTFLKSLLYIKFKDEEFLKDYEFYEKCKQNKNLSEELKIQLLQFEDYLQNGIFVTPNRFLYVLTDKCQLRCKHCYFGENTRQYEISFLQYKELFQKNKELIQYYLERGFEYEYPKYILMGGESLLHPEIEQITEYTLQNSEFVKFNSNGIAINNNICSMMNEHSNVKTKYQISLEGTDTYNDYIRGEGTFNKIVKNIIKLKRLLNNTEILVSFNANTENYHCIYEMAQILKSVGVNKLKLGRYLKCNNIIHPISTKQFKEYINLTEKCLKLEDDSFHIDDSRIYFPFKGSRCYCSSEIQVCYSNGDKLLCPRLHIKNGNYFKDDIRTIANNSLYWAGKVQMAPYECLKCKHHSKCMGGFRCNTYYELGDFNHRDVNCIFYER